MRLLEHGLSAVSSVYAGLFYATVGTHALHVVLAGLRALRMYWLFVVAVWPVLYGLVYLW